MICYARCDRGTRQTRSCGAHLQACKEARDDLGLCEPSCDKGNRAKHPCACSLAPALQLPHQPLRARLRTACKPVTQYSSLVACMLLTHTLSINDQDTDQWRLLHSQCCSAQSFQQERIPVTGFPEQAHSEPATCARSCDIETARQIRQ